LKRVKYGLAFVAARKVGGQIPEEEGLKRLFNYTTVRQVYVGGQIPEEEGLKPYYLNIPDSKILRWRANSRRRRIETIRLPGGRPLWA